MEYLVLVDLYEQLAATSKKLDKVALLGGFLEKLKAEKKPEWIYLLRGRVLPDYDTREFGISGQLTIKALSRAFGISVAEVVGHYKKLGDFGDISAVLAEKKQQQSLFSSRLTISKVFGNLCKLVDMSGKGSIEKKIALIAEILSFATPREARYIVRTLLNDLRVGVADALLVDALAATFFPDDAEACERVENAYDIANDFALVFAAAEKGLRGLEDIGVTPGKPMRVMLAVKVADLAEAFRICGKPAALEYKYDGFRMLISKKGSKITLFTRKLENVTSQFPDIVIAVRKHAKGENFIFDSEVVGYNPMTKKYKPFEAISQRIKRKYDIERLQGELPVEVMIFDVLYYDGVSLLDKPFSERRRLLENVVKTEPYVIRPATQIITGDEKEAERFYQKALKAGEEGVMVKKLDAPYKQGRKVGYMVKLKPVVQDLDVVIIGAEYGSGKRAGNLTSYIVACRSDSEFFEIGMVSSGLKEKESEGTSYEEMTHLLQPLIIKEDSKRVWVKPKLVISVTYQNIQKSSAYTSGYALRFPRITHYRPDRGIKDIATIDDIKREAAQAER